MLSILRFFIIPIFKKGDKNEASNYRGITLLSIIGKLFTRILNSRLNAWAEEYNIYVEAQAGFRKGMGTTDNIFILNSLITHSINQNERLYCAFVDFTKAFDFVVRDILWFKLIRLGVRGKMLNIIKSIYSSVKSRVKHDNTLSEPFTCNIGVRQGECLSPFLFAMYVNDFEAELAVKGIEGINIGMLNLYILLYADDIILLGKTPEDLQKALSVLSPSYTVTIQAPIQHDSSRFETDGKIGLHRDASGWKKRNSSINTMSHYAPTVSARFIYGPTTTHDGSATIHNGGATNAHECSRMLMMPPRFDTVLVRFKPVALR